MILDSQELSARGGVKGKHDRPQSLRFSQGFGICVIILALVSVLGPHSFEIRNT